MHGKADSFASLRNGNAKVRNGNAKAGGVCRFPPMRMKPRMGGHPGVGGSAWESGFLRFAAEWKCKSTEWKCETAGGVCRFPPMRMKPRMDGAPGEWGSAWESRFLRCAAEWKCESTEWKCNYLVSRKAKRRAQDVAPVPLEVDEESLWIGWGRGSVSGFGRRLRCSATVPTLVVTHHEHAAAGCVVPVL